MVRMRGLEPPRCHHHRLLRPARLPVPPHPRENSLYESCFASVKNSTRARFGQAHAQRRHNLISTSRSAIASVCAKVSLIHQMTPAPIIVCTVAILITDSISAGNEDSISPYAAAAVSRTAIQTSVTRVVTVYKLAAFPTLVIAKAAAPITIAAPLRQRYGWHHHQNCEREQDCECSSPLP